jgi:1-deoxy-D-xylulose-5-phosphate synthase
VQVLDPRWVKPIPVALLDRAQDSILVIVLEDGIRVGGVGAAISQGLRDRNNDVPVRNFGTPLAFLDHAKRASILNAVGLNSQDITRFITEWMAQRNGAHSLSGEQAPSDYLK